MKLKLITNIFGSIDVAVSYTKFISIAIDYPQYDQAKKNIVVSGNIAQKISVGRCFFASVSLKCISISVMLAKTRQPSFQVNPAVFQVY